MRRDEIAVDPTVELELPAVRGRRERIAGRAEAAALIDALPEAERALWATALYAGLRRGELRAMRWSDVDLAAEPAVIHVRRTWDDVEGTICPWPRHGASRSRTLGTRHRGHGRRDVPATTLVRRKPRGS
jgi:integrase